MTILTRFLGLKGRIGRLHYWLLLVLSVVIVLVAATIGSLNLQNRPIQWLSYGILLSSGWPVFSATTRRLRDADLSPWYGLLLIAVPTALQVCGLVVPWGAPAFGIASTATAVVGFIALGILRGRADR
jgi:uncharacterized membrane protein YhaH (DUF805 family)